MFTLGITLKQTKQANARKHENGKGRSSIGTCVIQTNQAKKKRPPSSQYNTKWAGIPPPCAFALVTQLPRAHWHIIIRLPFGLRQYSARFWSKRYCVLGFHHNFVT